MENKDIETNEQTMQESTTQEPVVNPETETETLTAEELLAQATAQNQELM